MGGSGVDSDGVPKWEVDARAVWEIPPLDNNGEPKVATEQELGAWHAGGARVWAYSANAGKNEQGRLELRTGNQLRTTWGWGEWDLVPSRFSGSHEAPQLALSWNGAT